MARQRSVLTERMWRERVRRFRQSGVTVAEFCDFEGVSTASFYVWQRRLRHAGAVACEAGLAGQSDPGQALFVPVSVRPVAAEVRIDVADGVVIRLPLDADERLLRSCLRAAVDAASRGEDG
jgi:hypothetical protein